MNCRFAVSRERNKKLDGKPRMQKNAFIAYKISKTLKFELTKNNNNNNNSKIEADCVAFSCCYFYCNFCHLMSYSVQQMQFSTFFRCFCKPVQC